MSGVLAKLSRTGHMLKLGGFLAYKENSENSLFNCVCFMSIEHSDLIMWLLIN